jgi:hypothetical protein
MSNQKSLKFHSFSRTFREYSTITFNNQTLSFFKFNLNLKVILQITISEFSS